MTRDTIINDLMRRRPNGPKGTNITYTVRDGEYSYRSMKYKQIAVPSDDSYGYDDESLFKMGFKDRSDVRNYIRNRDFENKSDWELGRTKATLNRRTNKVWERIESAIYNVSRRGGEGIYSVSERYGRRDIANLFARSYEEARETADLFFGYLISDRGDLKVKFEKFGTVDDVTFLNAKTTESIQTQVSRCKEEIESQTKRIEKLEAMLTTLHTVESQQIAVETVEALNRAAQASECAV